MFIYLGNTADAWAIGNDYFSVTNNLPSPIQQVWDRFSGVFNDSNLAGTAISWISTAPNGSYAIMTKGGELLSNIPDLVAAAQPSTSVEHVSLSPTGGWFIRFSDGTVQVSPPAGFSQAFCSLISPYLDMHCRSRQPCSVCHVFFGAEGAIVIRTDKELVTALLPHALQARFQEFTRGDYKTSGCVLGRNTVLCPWNPQFYFLEILSRTAPAKYLHQLPTPAIPSELVSCAEANQQPPPQVLSKYRTPPKSTLDKSPSTTSDSPPPPPPPPRRPTRASFTAPSAPSGLQPGTSYHRLSNSASSLSVPHELRAPAEPQQPAPSATPATIPSGFWNDSQRPEIPPAARMRYERQFQEECGGKPHLTGIEAAGVFFASGLGKSDLSRIWEETDRDQNGRFDKDEFVQAMWLIELSLGRVEKSSSPPNQPQPASSPPQWQHTVSPPPQNHAPPPPPPYRYSNTTPAQAPQHTQPSQHQQAPHPCPPQYHQSAQQPQPPATPSPNLAGLQPIEILVAIVCQGCGNGLGPDDRAHRLLTQYAAVHYFCAACHAAGKCPPGAAAVRLAAGKELAARNKASTRCGGCWRDMQQGETAWCCRKCWDRDLCQRCWAQRSRHCRHAAQGQVLMTRLGRAESDPWSVSDMVQTIGSIASSFR